MNEFRQFHVVSDHSDHNFRDLGSGNNITSNTKKSIMKEWKILEKNLPKSIYVRVYEPRIDLMRAVIIGPAGTPYQDSLFFFDIAFPSNYPRSPPKVHFISFGLKLHTYLYENGRVQLSLLHTCPIVLFIQMFEMWNPSVSTCLQLLLSLQTLIRNDVEHVYYDENVYSRTCELSLYLLRRPPKNFEALVKGHFRDRAKVILSAFIEYATGRLTVGYCGRMSHWILLTDTYRKWAEEIYPLMLNAFELCGASLDTFDRSLVLPRRTTILMAQIKKAFSWKKKKKNNEKED